MIRWFVVLVTLVSVGSVLAEGGATPAPSAAVTPAAGASPAAVLPPEAIIPSPEERVILEKLEKLKLSPPKDPTEAIAMSSEYAAALREHMAKFPRSPRAYLVCSALAQLLLQGGDNREAEKVARGFLKRAQGPEELFWGHQLLVELYTASGQTEKAVAAVETYLKSAPPPDGAEFFTYRLAGLLADLDRHPQAVALLGDFVRANPTTTQSSRFRLRIVDLLLSAGRAREAVSRLEEFSKGTIGDDDKALATYFLGIAHLALARDAVGAESEGLRKKALSFEETLMAGVRKDVRAYEPYGAMAFSAAADILLASGDKAGAIKVYQEMKDLFKDRPEGAFAARAVVDAELIGTKLTDVSGTVLDGKPVSLSSLRGKIVLVTPWATWLEPSKHEAPLLSKLAKLHAGKPFAIVGVCLNRQEDAAGARQFAKSVKMTWPTLFDGKGFDGLAGKLFKAEGPPGNLIVDENGSIVRANIHGTHLRDVLATEIARLARKTKGAPGDK